MQLPLLRALIYFHYMRGIYELEVFLLHPVHQKMHIEKLSSKDLNEIMKLVNFGSISLFNGRLFNPRVIIVEQLGDYLIYN